MELTERTKRNDSAPLAEAPLALGAITNNFLVHSPIFITNPPYSTLKDGINVAGYETFQSWGLRIFASLSVSTVLVGAMDH